VEAADREEDTASIATTDGLGGRHGEAAGEDPPGQGRPGSLSPGRRRGAEQGASRGPRQTQGPKAARRPARRRRRRRRSPTARRYATSPMPRASSWRPRTVTSRATTRSGRRAGLCR